MSPQAPRPHVGGEARRTASAPDLSPEQWVLDRLSGGWIRLAEDLSIIDIDSRWMSITGQTYDDALGHGWISAVDPSARLDFLDALRGAFATGTGTHGQLRLLHRDESARWIEFVGAPPISHGDGELGILAMFRDVTHDIETHRRAEELTRVLEASTDFVGIFDPRSLTWFWSNDAANQLFGAAKAPLPDLLDTPSRLLFDNVARVSLAHSSTWQGDLTFLVESDACVAELPVSALFVAHRNVDGTVDAISMVARDITRLRDAEQRVEASEIRLAALVEHASDIMCVIDPKGRVMYASPAFLRVLGYSPGALDGSNVLNLVHVDDSLRSRETVNHVISHVGETASFEVRVQHADSSWRHLEIVATNLLHNAAVNGLILNARDVTERVEAVSRLQARAFHDELTGLPNRVLLLERLRDALTVAAERRRMVGVLFLDLDRFKIVNDSLGHTAGDELLREVADRIRATIRPSDTVARLGGDEFVVLINDMARRSDSIRAARRLREAISDPIKLGADATVITTSVGIAIASGAEAPEDLLRDADTALYQAKEEGRDRAHIFDDDLRDRAVRRMSVEQEIRKALDENRFELFYQPILRTADSMIIGAEGLVRMRGEEGQLIMPEHFIEVAEDAGLMGTLGEVVFARACHDIAQWQAAHGIEVSVGVNVSARQLSDAAFAPWALTTMAHYGVQPHQIYIELTEGSLIASNPVTERTLRQLHESGIGLALDDFGTGFSSLSYLKRFPIGVLKIDRSFTDGLGADENDTAIVRATIALAHGLGIKVVAEGVETAEQLEALRTLGCDSVQGYLLGRPMPVDQLVALLA